MKDGNRGVSERVLELTLEIISLLSGEDYMIVRKPSDRLPPSDGPPGTQSPSPVPPPHSQKILELTHKMLSLLTGEVPVRCDDVTVYFSMEEWEYLEGHQELYRDVMMETRQPRTSPGGPAGRLRHKKIRNSRSGGNSQNSGAELLTDDTKEEMWSGSESCVEREAHENGMVGDHTQMGDVVTRDEAESAAQQSRDHSGGSLICPKCGVQLPKKSELIIHLRYHTGERQISCPDCSKIFITNSDLVRHRRIHTGEKPYACAECHKSFSQRSTLVTHRKTHTQEKPFTCAQCGNSFSQKSTLVKHQRIHTGEKPFSCPDCGKRFVCSSSLKRHRLFHRGAAPGGHRFSCGECGQGFKQHYTLIKHQQVHSDSPCSNTTLS